MTADDIERITGLPAVSIDSDPFTAWIVSNGDAALVARATAAIRAVGKDATADAFAAEWARTDPNAVPASVSPYQFRAWCLAHGISMAQIDSLIDAIPDNATRELVRVEWEYGLVVKRAHPMIDQFGAALGLTGKQIDQAFREAAGMA